MLDRLKTVAEEGLVLGVKYAIVVVVVLGACWFVFSDYQKVRQQAASGAQMGEACYRWVIAGIQTKHLPDDWTKVAPGVNVLGVPAAAPSPDPTPTPATGKK